MRPGVDETLRALREVRAHLRRTFPAIDHLDVQRILAEHGLSRYPDALMLAQPEGLELPVRRRPWRREIPEPSSPRRRWKARSLPYFFEAYYRLANVDLRELDLPLVLHWQINGRAEGRSPHPFIDLGWLTEQVPDALPGEVLDVYLTDRRRWVLSPSPYVETEAFMLHGPWDGTTHPLLQIIRDRPGEPWLHGSLGVIDLAGADDELHMAAGVLTARNPGLARLSGFSVFEPAQPEAGRSGVLGAGGYRVVPGFALAGREHVLALPGNEVLSGDGTAVRVGQRLVVLDVRDSVTCDTLVFVEAPLVESQIAALAGRAGDGVLVAAYDAGQQNALERRGVTTLAHGRQVSVEAAVVEIAGGQP